MKKKQLSKLALLGLTAGMTMATTALSAHAMTETNGTYLAGGSCGAGKCGGSQRPNPNPRTNNYTADGYAPSTNAPVNPNMAPKPEAMQNYTGPQTNNAQTQYNTQRSSGSCAGSSTQPGGQGSCGNRSAQPQGQNYNGQTSYNYSSQPNRSSHSCGGR